MKSTVYKAFVVGALLGLMPACSLLDREPLDQIGPNNFYTSAEQLSSFTIKLYDAFPNNIGGWSAGIATWDDGTDNQAVKDEPNQRMFSLDVWKVPSEGGLEFNTIRDINYFIGVVEGKMASNAIAGNATDIKHYLGEAYFFRAYHYFGKLKTYGDFPIVKAVLGDTEEVLKEHAKRQPRNMVARFILEDLDKALTLLRPTTPGNQRISQQVAHLFRSRVALYEGTFERYHRGSGRVPGDDKWPGKGKEWNKDFQINQEEEVNYFLNEAMKSAKQVADAAQLTSNTKVLNPDNPTAEWNPYFQMFGSNNLAGYPEVLLWRQHSRAASVLHHQSARIITGTKTGWTRGLVESFLTEDGKPLYAVSGRNDKTIKEVKQGRDSRLKLFVFAEDDVLRFVGSGVDRFTNAQLLESSETKESTGYRQRKGLNYDPAIHSSSAQNDDTGLIYFRAAEALLNYIEASYELNKSLTPEAEAYWQRLRTRAGITGSVRQTISATDMSIEAKLDRPSYDWAAFSSSKPIDATLYSIRRERRCEFAGEGFRMDDLKRWRAMDQVQNYQLEGVNFWTEIHNYPYFKKQDGSTKIVSDGSDNANISSSTLSNYIRPYQIRQANNTMYNGYTFYQAHYLSPFSEKEMQLCSPSNDAANSNLYQNPGWKTKANTVAEY